MKQIEYSGKDNLEVMLEAKKYNQFLLKLILSSTTEGNSIVDFGAGLGNFSRPIADAGYTVICVETDPILSTNLRHSGFTVVNDLEQIEDESVDYIYTLNVLEHIENDGATAELWYRKLRPGGKLFVYVPAFQILFTSMDRKVGHFRRYTRGSLAKIISTAGFKVAESKYADCLGFLATLLYKVADNGNGKVNEGMLKIYDKYIFPVSRICDGITHAMVGKNVYLRAVKPHKILQTNNELTP